MKTVNIITAAMLSFLAATGLEAQNGKGGISAEMLQEISKGYEGTAADKALHNALNSTSIATL